MADLPADHADRLQRAMVALDGLSLGDAFGECFFYREAWATTPRFREVPPGPWRYTDDTEMASAIVEVLHRHGRIEQDDLAATFARRYASNPHRGYGAGAHRILAAIGRGEDWRVVSRAAFGGQGSLGNGSAMRVAPLGACFCDRVEDVVEQARLSAEVTHLHPEGIAGGIAIAVATAWAAQRSRGAHGDENRQLFDVTVHYTPEGATRQGILAASRLPLNAWEQDAAAQLGNGDQITCPDTVPFCLWCAARHVDDYCEALWTTVKVGGDIDTNCAIVGGIVAAAVGRAGLPEAWLRLREPLAIPSLLSW
jgi:ADP-ribosylglycohydrolase